LPVLEVGSVSFQQVLASWLVVLVELVLPSRLVQLCYRH